MSFLHNLWIFIEYEDGHRENIGSADTLDSDKAHWFWKIYNKSKENPNIKYISLEDKGYIKEKYEFNYNGDIIANNYICIRLQGEW